MNFGSVAELPNPMVDRAELGCLDRQIGSFVAQLRGEGLFGKAGAPRSPIALKVDSRHQDPLGSIATARVVDLEHGLGES